MKKVLTKFFFLPSVSIAAVAMVTRGAGSAGTRIFQSQALFGERGGDLVRQVMEGRSFSCVKASRGGGAALAVGGGFDLHNLCAVVGPGFGGFPEHQLLTLNLLLPSPWSMSDVVQRADFGLNCFKSHFLRLDLNLSSTWFVVDVVFGAALGRDVAQVQLLADDVDLPAAW